MLFQLRKENIELNDKYNKIINEKTRLEAEYLKMKKRLDDFEKEKKFEKQKQSESFDVLVKSERNTSDSIVISILVISKKLLDSSVFIDEKDLNIEN